MLACTKTGLEAFKCIEILLNNGADTTLKNKVLLNNSNITEEKNKHQFIFWNSGWMDAFSFGM